MNHQRLLKQNSYLPSKWLTNDNKAITCEDKVKLLDENLVELHDMAKDLIEDAILLGCNELFVKETLVNMINKIEVI